MISSLVHKKILVVEDMATLREELVACLKKLGFAHIHQAVDGLDGWEKVQESASRRPFELIFSDIVMPNCTGIEFLKKVRSLEPFKKIPVVMVTSESEIQTVFEAINAGATSYLLKPFNSNSLEQKISEVFKLGAQK